MNERDHKANTGARASRVPLRARDFHKRPAAADDDDVGNGPAAVKRAKVGPAPPQEEDVHKAAVASHISKVDQLYHKVKANDRIVRKLRRRVEAAKGASFKLTEEGKAAAAYIDVLNLHELPDCALPWLQKRPLCSVSVSAYRAGNPLLYCYHILLYIGRAHVGTGMMMHLGARAYQHQMYIRCDRLRTAGTKDPDHYLEDVEIGDDVWTGAIDVKTTPEVAALIDPHKNVDAAAWKTLESDVHERELEYLLCVRTFHNLRAWAIGDKTQPWAHKVSHWNCNDQGDRTGPGF